MLHIVPSHIVACLCALHCCIVACAIVHCCIVVLHCCIVALLHCWMPDVHTAINMGGPILGSCPPILCRCLTRQLLISSMAPNMFFLSVFCPREMTAGDFHLKEGRSGIAPNQRSLYFPPNIRGNPKCPCHHHGHRSLPRQFHGNSKDNLGDTRQGSNMLKWFSGQRDAETC